MTPEVDPELAQLTDEQFCELVEYALDNAGDPHRPRYPRTIDVECSTKTVTIEYQVMGRGWPFRRAAKAYMEEIEPKACSNTDAMMVAFRARGWQQHFTFKSRARKTITHTIEC